MAGYAVGLTGGIASGKSTVSDAFAALGVPVVDADHLAREVVAAGTDGLAELMECFGVEILDASGGGLDRRRMRARVFADPHARERLEAIIHPRVRILLAERLMAAEGPYALAAIPLLAEGGGRSAYPSLDRILVVDVSAEIQRERVMQRDSIDASLALQMIEAQATRRQRLAIADDVLVNASTLDELAGHVGALDRRYRVLAGLAANSAVAAA